MREREWQERWRRQDEAHDRLDSMRNDPPVIVLTASVPLLSRQKCLAVARKPAIANMRKTAAITRPTNACSRQNVGEPPSLCAITE
jgi:hypothetical protein